MKHSCCCFFPLLFSLILRCNSKIAKVCKVAWKIAKNYNGLFFRFFGGSAEWARCIPLLKGDLLPEAAAAIGFENRRSSASPCANEQLCRGQFPRWNKVQSFVLYKSCEEPMFSFVVLLPLSFYLTQNSNRPTEEL
jgi:hypothetical protein